MTCERQGVRNNKADTVYPQPDQKRPLDLPRATEVDERGSQVRPALPSFQSPCLDTADIFPLTLSVVRDFSKWIAELDRRKKAETEASRAGAGGTGNPGGSGGQG